MKEIGRNIGRIAGRVGVALVVLIGVYASAGMIGDSIPANASWVQPVTGVRIFVEDNGIHTGIVMPVAAAGWICAARFPPATSPAPVVPGSTTVRGWFRCDPPQKRPIAGH